jgi:cation/acetate symporter
VQFNSPALISIPLSFLAPVIVSLLTSKDVVIGHNNETA